MNQPQAAGASTTTTTTISSAQSEVMTINNIADIHQHAKIRLKKEEIGIHGNDSYLLMKLGVIQMQIKTIHVIDNEVMVVMQDETAEINGYINRRARRDLGKKLQVGSWLLLDKVSLVRFQRNMTAYLNIMRSNITALTIDWQRDTSLSQIIDEKSINTQPNKMHFNMMTATILATSRKKILRHH